MLGGLRAFWSEHERSRLPTVENGYELQLRSIVGGSIALSAGRSPTIGRA